MTRRIAFGGASPEGENSAYLLADRGVLIDPGPPGDAAWQTLQEGIADAELSVGDIEHVIVTHWHIDHAGLAPRLAEAAGATVHMHERDAPMLADYAVEREARLQRDARRLRAWEVPEDVIGSVRDGDTPSPVPEEYPVVAHADGEVVAGIELLHTPGHTMGHLALALGGPTGGVGWGGAASPELFVGDAVLPTYTPNVGGSDTRLSDPLTTFLRTLSRIESRGSSLPGGTARPGHGSSVVLARRIGEMRRHHRQRIRNIDRVFEEYERVTPWQVATELFGEMAGIHAKMGAGEAAAHLRYMEDCGVVEQFGSSPDQYLRCWDVDITAALGLSVTD